MPDRPAVPRRIVLAAYRKAPEAAAEMEAIQAHLKNRELEAACGMLDEAGLRQRVKNGEFDLLVAVGGDGTMLRASHLCAPVGVPILGINTGRLGFLMQVQAGEWQPDFERLLGGDFWIEARMMLRAEHGRSGETLSSWHALNEVVVTRGQYVRPVRVAASLDGRLLTTYVADGLIAATATGSTAYALAAGGPILPPELRNILLVPIAPHLSVDRAVVLSEGTAVSMRLTEGEGVMSVDGQIPVGLAENDTVEVRAGDFTARFVRFGDPDYFYRTLTAHMNQNPSIGLPR